MPALKVRIYGHYFLRVVITDKIFGILAAVKSPASFRSENTGRAYLSHRQPDQAGVLAFVDLGLCVGKQGDPLTPPSERVSIR